MIRITITIKGNRTSAVLWRLLPTVHEFFQRGGNGFCPDLVAFAGRVQSVTHDIRWGIPGRVKKLGTDVQVVNLVGIVQFGNRIVDFANGLANRIVGWSSRKDPEEQDSGLWKALSQLQNHSNNSLSNLFGRVSSGVIGPDHQQDDPGRNPFSFTVLESIQHPLSRFACDAEVRDVPLPEALLQNLLAREWTTFVSPEVGD